MKQIDANLYNYGNIKNDRLFGINGIVNPSLSQEYIEANTIFVQYINNITYNNVYSQCNDNIILLNTGVDNRYTNQYYIPVIVDENLNKLNKNTLNNLIMNKYIYMQNNYYKPNNNDKLILNTNILK